MRTAFFVLVILATMAGCHARQPTSMVVDISLSNNSTNAIDWLKLKWNGPYVPGGILPPEVSKTTVNAEWPNVSTAKLTFVDEKTRKPYVIDLSFPEVNEQVRAGKCHDVTIRILSYDKADVICK